MFHRHSTLPENGDIVICHWFTCSPVDYYECNMTVGCWGHESPTFVTNFQLFAQTMCRFFCFGYYDQDPQKMINSDIAEDLPSQKSSTKHEYEVSLENLKTRKFRDENLKIESLPSRFSTSAKQTGHWN